MEHGLRGRNENIILPIRHVNAMTLRMIQSGLREAFPSRVHHFEGSLLIPEATMLCRHFGLESVIIEGSEANYVKM
jgi:hypothetical protein